MFEFVEHVGSLEDPREMYIDLLKRVIIHWPWLSDQARVKRVDGRDWPEEGRGDTMIGALRVENLYRCVRTVIEEKVQGDFVETGVWRGGASLLMAAMTVVFREDYRKVWLCDSFEGLPEPSPAIYPADAGSVWYKYKQLAVDIESVERLFKSYGLNGENIRYVRGYFRDTLDLVTCDKIAVLRMDADMYESTIQVLNALLKRVQSGGYVIVDDYYAVPECKLAVDEYLAREHMSVSIKQIDWGGAFWRVE